MAQFRSATTPLLDSPSNDPFARRHPDFRKRPSALASFSRGRTLKPLQSNGTEGLATPSTTTTALTGSPKPISQSSLPAQPNGVGEGPKQDALTLVPTTLLTAPTETELENEAVAAPGTVHAPGPFWKKAFSSLRRFCGLGPRSHGAGRGMDKPTRRTSTLNSTSYLGDGVHLERAHSRGATEVHALGRRSPFGALFSRTLPKYTGPYAVGVTDMEVPIETQSFGNFKHRSMPTRKAGLTIDTVLFTLFYPCDAKSGTSKRVVWFPKLGQTVDGFLRMASRVPNNWYRSVTWPAAAAAVLGTTFPAHANAHIILPSEADPPPFVPHQRPHPAHRSTTAAALPVHLANSPPDDFAPSTPPKKDDVKWPLVIFSHGVGCSRLMYSALCGQLASRGFVVAAIEHRDGTGPSSSIRTADGQQTKLDFLDFKDLEWPDLPDDDQPRDDTTLRHEQLKVRLAEMEQTVSILRRMSAGARHTDLCPTSEHNEAWCWDSWGCIDTDPGNVAVVGHSLGGSAAILSGADSQRFPWRRMVVMDPAIQRLEPWMGTVPCPMLAINSDEFTRSADRKRLARLCRTAQDYITYKISGSTHPSFSDIHLILPNGINRLIGLEADPRRVLDLTVRGTVEFLRSDKSGMRKRPKSGKHAEWELCVVGHDEAAAEAHEAHKDGEEEEEGEGAEREKRAVTESPKALATTWEELADAPGETVDGKPLTDGTPLRGRTSRLSFSPDANGRSHEHTYPQSHSQSLSPDHDRDHEPDRHPERARTSSPRRTLSSPHDHAPRRSSDRRRQPSHEAGPRASIDGPTGSSTGAARPGSVSGPRRRTSSHTFTADGEGVIESTDTPASGKQQGPRRSGSWVRTGPDSPRRSASWARGESKAKPSEEARTGD